MGYSTEFVGGLDLNRDLTHKEWMELKRLGNYDSKHDGYYAEFMETPDTIPDSYNKWEPSEDGTQIVWNQAEKFYDYIHWLRWIVKHYLKPRGLVLNGEIRWQGEDMEDVGVINATDNKITTRKLVVEGAVRCPDCGHKFVPEND